jgi:hypothetical protein
MLEDTRNRLKKYLEIKGYSVASLEKAIGAGNGSVALFIQGKNKGLGNNLEKILIHFEQLNGRWLLTGKGPIEIEDMPDVKSQEIKNEMYIKPPEQGVTYFEQKGGNLRDNLIANFEHEKHIKSVFESPVTDHKGKGTGKRYQEGTEKELPIASDEERASYGDLKDILTRSAQDQTRILGIILDRLESLESRLPDPPAPELPGG